MPTPTRGADSRATHYVLVELFLRVMDDSLCSFGVLASDGRAPDSVCRFLGTATFYANPKLNRNHGLAWGPLVALAK